MQRMLLTIAIGLNVVAASFGLTLSIIDHGFAATLTNLVRFIDP